MDAETNPCDPKWTELPHRTGRYWYRVRLSDGLIYNESIKNVMVVHGAMYHADENWSPVAVVGKSSMVTWYGPLVPPK